MKKLKSYEEFVNESTVNESTVNEANNNYVYVSDERFKNIKDLFNEIEASIGKAFSEFIKEEFDLNIAAKGTIGRQNRVNVESAKISPKEFGIFKYAMTSATIGNFSGGVVVWNEETSEFHPYVHMTIHISYEHVGGGSNGTSLRPLGTNSDWVSYDILNKKFINNDEMKADSKKIWINPHKY